MTTPEQTPTAMTSFWVSWYSEEAVGEWELHSPWWISGYRVSDDAATVCAAIRAMDEADAKRQVLASYDTAPASLEWRFCEHRAADWVPFSDRFPKADWMRWQQ